MNKFVDSTFAYFYTTCLYVCMYIYIYMCVCVYMYIYIYIYVYICIWYILYTIIYMYTYRYTRYIYYIMSHDPEHRRYPPVKPGPCRRRCIARPPRSWWRPPWRETPCRGPPSSVAQCQGGSTMAPKKGGMVTWDWWKIWEKYGEKCC